MKDQIHIETLRWLDGQSPDLSETEKSRLQAHLDTCTECRTYANDLATLKPALSELFHERWDSRRPQINVVQKVRPTTRLHTVKRWISDVSTVALGLLALVAFLAMFRIFLPRPVTPATATPTISPSPTVNETGTITSTTIATTTPSPSPSAISTLAAISQSPSLAPRLVNASRPNEEDSQAIPSLWNYYDLTNELQLKQPGSRQFVVDITSNQTFLWPLYWCAVDEEQLANNLEAISVSFRIDNVEVSAEKLLEFKRSSSEWACHYWEIQLSDWQRGAEINLDIQYHLSREIDDGYEKYAPGDYLYQLTANVVIP